MAECTEAKWPPEPQWNIPVPRPDDDRLAVMIPSAAVRDALRAAGRSLTDLDRAVLLERSQVTWQEKLAWLRRLCERTGDAQLKRQIERLIGSRTQALDAFVDNAGCTALYRPVWVWNDESVSEGKLHPTAEEAWSALKEDADCQVSELRIDRLPILPTAAEEPHVVSMMIGDDGSLLSLRGTPDGEWEVYVSGNFEEIPHPFRRGDIVCTTDGKVHGVVETGSTYRPDAGIRQTPGPWNEEDEPFRVAVLNKELGLFSATAAIQPAQLEYYEAREANSLGSMDELLRMLSLLYQGRGWMPEFTGYTYYYRDARGYRD